MNRFGLNLSISLFGESHGSLIGATLDGLPAGIKIDEENIAFEMRRRQTSREVFSSTRYEPDHVLLASGIFEGKTTGAPLTVIIYNHDISSQDYTKGLIRPGHGDLPAYVKFKGFNDYRGAGHMSGRLTAPLVALGAIAKQILKNMDIFIAGQIKSIYMIEDIDGNILDLQHMDFPVFSQSAKEKMIQEIKRAKDEKDSVGGKINIQTSPLPIGLGEPFFLSMESHISSMFFSIPSVKGVSFGDGFLMPLKKGSMVNDEIVLEEGGPKLLSNFQGGINGGLTNGNPIFCSVAIRPTPTIGKKQQSISVLSQENIEIEATGRHDVCIVPRILPVLEAGLALVLLDFLLPSIKTEGMKL